MWKPVWHLFLTAAALCGLTAPFYAADEQRVMIDITLADGAHAYEIARLYPDKVIVTSGQTRLEIPRKEILKASNPRVAGKIQSARKLIETSTHVGLDNLTEISNSLEKILFDVEEETHLYGWLIPEASETSQALKITIGPIRKTLSLMNGIDLSLKPVLDKMESGSPPGKDWDALLNDIENRAASIPATAIKNQYQARLKEQTAKIRDYTGNFADSQLKKIDEIEDTLKSALLKGELTKAELEAQAARMTQIALVIPLEERRSQALEQIQLKTRTIQKQIEDMLSRKAFAKIEEDIKATLVRHAAAMAPAQGITRELRLLHRGIAELPDSATRALYHQKVEQASEELFAGIHQRWLASLTPTPTEPKPTATLTATVTTAAPVVESATNLSAAAPSEKSGIPGLAWLFGGGLLALAVSGAWLLFNRKPAASDKPLPQGAMPVAREIPPALGTVFWKLPTSADTEGGAPPSGRSARTQFHPDLEKRLRAGLHYAGIIPERLWNFENHCLMRGRNSLNEACFFILDRREAAAPPLERLALPSGAVFLAECQGLLLFMERQTIHGYEHAGGVWIEHEKFDLRNVIKNQPIAKPVLFTELPEPFWLQERYLVVSLPDWGILSFELNSFEGLFSLKSFLGFDGFNAGLLSEPIAIDDVYGFLTDQGKFHMAFPEDGKIPLERRFEEIPIARNQTISLCRSAEGFVFLVPDKEGVSKLREFDLALGRLSPASLDLLIERGRLIKTEDGCLVMSDHELAFIFGRQLTMEWSYPLGEQKARDLQVDQNQVAALTSGEPGDDRVIVLGKNSGSDLWDLTPETHGLTSIAAISFASDCLLIWGVDADQNSVLKLF